MRKTCILLAASAAILSCSSPGGGARPEEPAIGPAAAAEVAAKLAAAHPGQESRAQAGARRVADLWRASDGSPADYQAFCLQWFEADTARLRLLYGRLESNFETLWGRFNQITVDLCRPAHLSGIEPHPVDDIFAAYSVGAHLADDLFANKAAFVAALNFPHYTLAQKNALGASWSRQEWAYARMGDLFASRVPAAALQAAAQAEAKAEGYIADYNLYVGRMVDPEGRALFPEDLKLLSHWNLRDQIKADYADARQGLARQRLVYRAMERIVDQTIPREVVNSPRYRWSPYTNQAWDDAGQAVDLAPEGAERYQRIVDCHAAQAALDRYHPASPTYIERAFDQGKEVSQPEVERLFDEYLSSPLAAEVGRLISERLGRPLEPFDIWYDGFKARASMDQDALDRASRRRFPTAQAFQDQMPGMLRQLGFAPAEAAEIASRIAVDPARGSGHAWPAQMRGDRSRLRTRVGERGMDYKGYNIAVHEFGHNVQQTLSLYDVDHYMLNGVPSTAFTEAIAFLFQCRDLQILGVGAKPDPRAASLDVLDQFWSMFEIMGVSMVDMAVWKWLYANPGATAPQLRDQALAIARDVWNRYYAPVFGQRDATVLAIYSHMVASPLYLSDYPFGHLIHFQLEQHLRGRDFASEVRRIYTLGRLTPDAWMRAAVGEGISIRPVLEATREALGRLAAE